MSAAEKLSDLDPKPSRVRADTDVVLERIMHVAELMSAGKYVKGKTSHELAEMWGIKHTAVENYTSEASRIVRLLERPRARLRIARALDAGLSVAEEALESEGFCQECGEKCGHSDLEALGKIPALADKYAALTGANEPTKQQHEVSGSLAVTLPAEVQELMTATDLPSRVRLARYALEAGLGLESAEERLEVARALVRELEAEAGEVLALPEGET